MPSLASTDTACLWSTNTSRQNTYTIKINIYFKKRKNEKEKKRVYIPLESALGSNGIKGLGLTILKAQIKT